MAPHEMPPCSYPDLARRRGSWQDKHSPEKRQARERRVSALEDRLGECYIILDESMTQC